MGRARATEGYVRLLKVALMAALVALGALWMEKRELEKEKTPPACLVNSSGGIDLCKSDEAAEP